MLYVHTLHMAYSFLNKVVLVHRFFSNLDTEQDLQCQALSCVC